MYSVNEEKRMRKIKTVKLYFESVSLGSARPSPSPHGKEMEKMEIKKLKGEKQAFRGSSSEEELILLVFMPFVGSEFILSLSEDRTIRFF